MFEVGEFLGGEGLADFEVVIDDLSEVERKGEVAIDKNIDAVLVADAGFKVGDLVFGGSGIWYRRGSGGVLF